MGFEKNPAHCNARGQIYGIYHNFSKLETKGVFNGQKTGQRLPRRIHKAGRR